jgi:membrane protein YdbS with pleckstrin-like domain
MPTPPPTTYNHQLHPAVFLIPFVLLTVSAFVLLPLALLTSFLLAGLSQSLGYSPANAKHLLLLATLTIIILVFLSSLILVTRGFRHSLIQLTTSTLLVHTGFISLTRFSLPLKEIITATAHQPRLARKLHYATITLTLQNTNSIDLPFVPHPETFLQNLQNSHPLHPSNQIAPTRRQDPAPDQGS